MGKVAVITDSNSGITQKEAKELGIRVLPMPFYIDGEVYYEDITLTQKEFYERLTDDADISTSQPAPADVMELWEEALQEADEVIYIPMSSGLSGSCQTAMMLAEDFDGKVFVVNNQRISITQRQSVLDALEMAADGMSGKEIYDVLMREKLEASHQREQELTNNNTVARPAPKTINLIKDERIIVTECNDIYYAAADEKVTRVYTRREEFVMPMNITEFCNRLPEEKFFRCHRSYCVNLSKIREIVPWFNNTYVLRLTDLEFEVPVSRGKVKAFRQLMRL